jgi:hypothetical protein
MAYKISKEGEITIDGFENGIASSPHKGLANIQNANISTEIGEVMASYNRVLQTQANNTAQDLILTPLTTTTFSAKNSNGLAINMLHGMWINVGAGITGLSAGVYYVIYVTGGSFSLSDTYDNSSSPTVKIVTVSGTATFHFQVNFENPIDYAIENYYDGTIMQTRYYVLTAGSSASYVWVYDTGVTASNENIKWFLPFYNATGNIASGIAVLNGFLVVFGYNGSVQNIMGKPTVLLGNDFTIFTTVGTIANGSLLTNHKHSAYVGHQGRLYYTDGNIIGSIFPNTSVLSGGGINIQSYASYTASGTTGTIATLISGSIPFIPTSTSIRIPAVFFTSGTKPTAITVGTIYYILYSSSGTFTVFAAATGGSALDIETGSAGTQYFNTFYPISASGATAMVFSPQALFLPYYEIAQCLVEVGNTLLIGCASNYLYPWNQVDVLASDLIPLPENNVSTMIVVNNMAYIFAGNKGNIYVTNGNTASVALTVPDYCAGVPGTPSSYIEPYFIWGGAMFCRGQVFFSIKDQTATKAGNCGGIWSFTPTQNMYPYQNTGISLHLKNQASYNTYNGFSSILIPAQNQQGRGVQYWNGWSSSITNPTYGIDFTDTIPHTADQLTLIETDIIPTGTTINKKTFSQIEYKLSAPLRSGETVTMKYRQNLTDAWTPCNTFVVESTTSLSGIVTVSFEKGQWLQLQASLNVQGDSNSSFIRLKQILVR